MSAKKKLQLTKKLKITLTKLEKKKTSVINGKTGEIRRNGAIFRKRSLTDTLENLHKVFLSENPSMKIFPLETCACKLHENFTFKVKKLQQD